MMEHRATSRIRKNGNGFNLQFPKHLANMMELTGGEVVEWVVTEYDDDTVECTAVMLFEE